MEKIDITEKAYIDVLFALESGAKSFNDLKELGFSPNTILSRLREAQRKGIIEEKLFPQKDKKAQIKYIITNRGKNVLNNYLPIKSQYLNLKRELDKLEQEIRAKEKDMKLLLTSVSKFKDM